MKTKNVKNYFTCILAIFLTSCTQTEKKEMDEIEKRVENLLSQMTLEEKIGQMNQISAFGKSDVLVPLIRKGEVGSILNEVDPETINAFQRVAVEETRLGIPLLVARDVIHGFKTIFPIPLGQAASFNPELVEAGARVAAVESSAIGIRWAFAPMIDISRDPRWGRIAESCGEDPYLTSVMGVAMIKGLQGDSLNHPTSVVACPKHFIGYGAAEGGRDYNSSFISERLLRNVYFPPFEAAINAGAATIMTSFNDNDGVPASANSFILKDVLRNEWGFDGMVVTDWASTKEMIAHGFVANDKEAALKSVNAGVDMEMVSYTFVKHLQELIKEGKVQEETINNAVRNILRLKFRLGLFEQPYANVKDPKSVWYTDNHLELAKQTAVESVILLKNEKQTLPLKETIRTVAVVGPLADAPHDQLGTWIFDGEKSHTITPLKALESMLGDNVKIIYEPALAYSRDKSTSGIKKAVAAAQKADVILAFLGEESILSGEAHCLADLNLQGAQKELVEALASTKKPLVTVVMAGRPLTIGKEVELSDAVLYSFHPGTMGGPAIADLLFGKAVPSAKTPITFPKMVGQIPIYYAHNNTGRPAEGTEVLIDDIKLEAIQVSLGNKSYYLDAGFDPLYPFGYGLSYTSFAYKNVSLSSVELKREDVLTVSFDLENTGNYEGTEVVQLYVQQKFGSVTRPVKELKKFMKVTLKPGETKHISMELPIEELAFWNIDMKKVVENGPFALWVATDSRSGSEMEFSVID